MTMNNNDFDEGSDNNEVNGANNIDNRNEGEEDEAVIMDIANALILSSSPLEEETIYNSNESNDGSDDIENFLNKAKKAWNGFLSTAS